MVNTPPPVSIELERLEGNRGSTTTTGSPRVSVSSQHISSSSSIGSTGQSLHSNPITTSSPTIRSPTISSPSSPPPPTPNRNDTTSGSGSTPKPESRTHKLLSWIWEHQSISGLMVLISVVAAYVVIPPTTRSLALNQMQLNLAKWTAKKDFIEYCNALLDAGTETPECVNATTAVLHRPPDVNFDRAKRGTKHALESIPNSIFLQIIIQLECLVFGATAIIGSYTKCFVWKNKNFRRKSMSKQELSEARSAYYLCGVAAICLHWGLYSGRFGQLDLQKHSISVMVHRLTSKLVAVSILPALFVPKILSSFKIKGHIDTIANRLFVGIVIVGLGLYLTDVFMAYPILYFLGVIIYTSIIFVTIIGSKHRRGLAHDLMIIMNRRTIITRRTKGHTMSLSYIDIIILTYICISAGKAFHFLRATVFASPIILIYPAVLLCTSLILATSRTKMD